MSGPREPLFLARRTYRRRRVADAAVFLPFVGIVLFLLPILWSDTASTRSGLVYVFVVWALLIVAVAPISLRLKGSLREHDAQNETADDPGAGDPSGRAG